MQVKFRLLGVSYTHVLRVTLNSGLCLGYLVTTLGYICSNLGLSFGDSGRMFSYLVLSFGNFEAYHGSGLSGPSFGYFGARFSY